jgi:hypothetical protein
MFYNGYKGENFDSTVLRKRVLRYLDTHPDCYRKELCLLALNAPITKAKAAFCPVRFTAEEKKPLDYLSASLAVPLAQRRRHRHLYFWR